MIITLLDVKEFKVVELALSTVSVTVISAELIKIPSKEFSGVKVFISTMLEKYNKVFS